MNYLLALFSANNVREENSNLPSTINIQADETQYSSENSVAESSLSSAQPNNLINRSAAYQLSDQESNTQSDTGSIVEDSQPEAPQVDAFAEAFGDEILQQLPELERARTTVLAPIFEEKIKKLDLSQISRHMWAHCKDRNFKTKDEMYVWIRSQWKVEILSSMSVTSAVKTAGTRYCQLCMQERIQIFSAMHDKKTQHKLINSKDEMYGHCTCKTRFLRLSAVGNAGADEV